MKTTTLARNGVSAQTVELISRLVESIPWPARRRAMGDVTASLLDGKPRVAESVFGWSRRSVEVGMHEARGGICCVNDLSARVKPRTEDKHPDLLAEIQTIMEPHSQSESSLRTTLLIPGLRRASSMSIQGMKSCFSLQVWLTRFSACCPHTLEVFLHSGGQHRLLVSKLRQCHDEPFIARGSRAPRCPGCRVIFSHCLCALRPRVPTRAGMCLIMCDIEPLKPSNTGWLIADVVRDTAGKRPLFVLLDATWPEARKMFRKSPYLNHLPVLSLQPEQLSRYRLRRSTRDDHLCTSEVAALCLALGGEPQAGETLETYLEVFTNHYLIARQSVPPDLEDVARRTSCETECQVRFTWPSLVQRDPTVTTGRFLVAKFNVGHTPFVAFGTVPKAANRT